MPISPADVLPYGRMVEIVRIDGDAPGPRPRQVPLELKPGMLARVTQAHQIGTNGSAVLMYELRVGGEPERRGDPEPITAQLYAADINPLPVLPKSDGMSALEHARRRYVGTDQRSISDKELKEIRSKPLKSLVTPEMVAKVKADAERAKVEAEVARQKAIAACRAEAEAAQRAAQPRFAEGTQNDRLPIDMVKALADTAVK